MTPQPLEVVAVVLMLALMFAAVIAGAALAIKAVCSMIEWGWSWREVGWLLLGCLLLAIAVTAWVFMSVISRA